MARLRYNGLRVVLGGSLTNSATSITFATPLTHSGGTNVPTLTGIDYIPLALLDSNGHLTEIVHLTAYTSGSTTGTIVRGREGTTGVSHTTTDQAAQANVVRDALGDPPPTTTNAKDDEFDGISAVSWTSGPTAPTTFDINTTAPQAAYMRANLLTTAFASKYQAIPASYPFTVTTRANSNRRGNSSLGLGLFLSVASPTGASPIMWLGPDFTSGALGVQRLNYSSFATTAFVSAATAAGLAGCSGPLFLRIVAASATSIKTQASYDGIIWHTLDSALNPGFTPGVMGLAMSENGVADLEGVADFFRVT